MRGYWKYMVVAGVVLYLCVLSDLMPLELALLAFTINVLGFGYLMTEICEWDARKHELDFKAALFRLEWSNEAEGRRMEMQTITEVSFLRAWRGVQDGRLRTIEELWDSMDVDDEAASDLA